MTKPIKFRKKPVVIEAIQYKGTTESFGAIKKWCDSIFYRESFEIVYIETLEGDMIVSKGDWVIRGIRGEFYPIKNDIFKETYERVE